MPRPVKSAKTSRGKARSAAAPVREVPTTTLPLRELLRRPLRVKQLIAAGHEVRITDNGEPLWRINGVRGTVPATESRATYGSDDEFWDELLSAVPASPSLLAVLEKSRK